MFSSLPSPPDSRARFGGAVPWQILIGCLLATMPMAPDVAAATSRPNIILIVTDDQGWGDLSCHGNSVLETPHLDSLASRGAELTRFYVSPVCSPTRASLMTGRYNFRTRVTDTFKGHSMMDPDETTIAEVLSAAGYATGIFGKWHLGDCYPMRPQDQGFEQAVVLRGGGIGQPSDPIEGAGRYTDPILWRNGSKFQAEGYCTDVYFDEATNFVEEQVSAEKPFFVYIATNAPHGPYRDVPEELYRKYKSRDLSPVLLGHNHNADTVARVFAMVENIDQNVGRLLALIHRLGIERNTLVVFMSDNGPETPRFVGPIRGTKTEVYEGGIRSPFIACWPGQIEPGTTSDRVAAHIDVMPTLLAVAGVDAPPGRMLDGRSLMPLLTGDADGWTDRSIFLQAHRGGLPELGHNMAAISQRWKLVRPSGFQRTTAPEHAPNELYDLEADPAEARNLIDEQVAIADQMQSEYAAWFEDVSQTRPDNYAPPRILVGGDQEPETILTWQDWQTTGPNWGEQGEWLIHVRQPTTVQVTVLLEEPAAGDARLTIDGTIHHQEPTTPLQRIVFETIHLPAGDSSVRFELEDDSESHPPFQIILARK